MEWWERIALRVPPAETRLAAYRRFEKYPCLMARTSIAGVKKHVRWSECPKMLASWHAFCYLTREFLVTWHVFLIPLIDVLAIWHGYSFHWREYYCQPACFLAPSADPTCFSTPAIDVLATWLDILVIWHDYSGQPSGFSLPGADILFTWHVFRNPR